MRPNFFIVGGAKCGTTNISYYLNDHPDVFIPELMEPYYYARFDVPKFFKRESMITDEKTYLKLFQNAIDHKAIGESSPVYLQCPHSAKEIKKDNTESKIIISIRNPIEKAHSSYFSYKFMNLDKRSFVEKIDLFKKQFDSNYFYIFNFIEDGFFSKHIKRYQDIFSPENIKIIYFENYIKDIPGHIKSLQEFLDLDNNSDFTEKPKNSFRVPRNKIANSLLQNKMFRDLSTKLVPTTYRDRIGEKFFVKQSTKPPLHPNEQKLLKEIFLPEYENLKELLGIYPPWSDYE